MSYRYESDAEREVREDADDIRHRAIRYAMWQRDHEVNETVREAYTRIIEEWSHPSPQDTAHTQEAA